MPQQFPPNVFILPHLPSLEAVKDIFTFLQDHPATAGGRVLANGYLKKLEDKARSRRATIVIPEATHPEVLRAVERFIRNKIGRVILLGNPEEISEIARRQDLQIEGVEVIDPDAPENAEIRQEFAAEYCKIINSDPGDEKAISRALRVLFKRKSALRYATGMVVCGYADCMIAGKIYKSEDVYLTIKLLSRPVKGVKTISGDYLMCAESPDIGTDGKFIVSDMASQICPDAVQLADIAVNTAHNVDKYINPETIRIAFIFAENLESTKIPQAIKEANARLKREYGSRVIIAERPMRINEALEGGYNGIICPDLFVGNMAYKLLQRLANFTGFAILTGGASVPIFDISRGAGENEIYTSMVTACLGPGMFPAAPPAMRKPEAPDMLARKNSNEGEIKISTAREEWPRAQEYIGFIANKAKEAGFNLTYPRDIFMAIREIAENAFKYGNEYNPQKFVTLRWRITKENGREKFICEITDENTDEGFDEEAFWYAVRFNVHGSDANGGRGLHYAAFSYSDEIFFEKIQDSEGKKRGTKITLVWYKDRRYGRKVNRNLFQRVYRNNMPCDIKGKHARDSNEVVRGLLSQHRILEIEYDGTKLEAYRILPHPDYKVGQTPEREYRGHANINNFLTPQEQEILIEWMKRARSILGRPPLGVRQIEYPRIRIALGEVALHWEGDIDHSNIAHAGYYDRCIYMGERFLKYLLRYDQRDLMEDVLTNDELWHLLDEGNREHPDGDVKYEARKRRIEKAMNDITSPPRRQKFLNSYTYGVAANFHTNTLILASGKGVEFVIENAFGTIQPGKKRIFEKRGNVKNEVPPDDDMYGFLLALSTAFEPFFMEARQEIIYGQQERHAEETQDFDALAHTGVDVFFEIAVLASPEGIKIRVGLDTFEIFRVFAPDGSDGFIIYPGSIIMPESVILIAMAPKIFDENTRKDIVLSPKGYEKFWEELTQKTEGSLSNALDVIEKDFNRSSFTKNEFQRLRRYSDTVIYSELNGLHAAGILGRNKDRKPYRYFLRYAYQQKTPEKRRWIKRALQALHARPSEAELRKIRKEIDAVLSWDSEDIKRNAEEVIPLLVNALIAQSHKGKILLALDRELGQTQNIRRLIYKYIIRTLKTIYDNDEGLLNSLLENLIIISDEGEKLSRRVNSVITSKNIKGENVIVVTTDTNLESFEDLEGRVFITAVDQSQLKLSAGGKADYYPLVEIVFFAVLRAFTCEEERIDAYGEKLWEWYRRIPNVEELDKADFMNKFFENDPNIPARTVILKLIPQTKKFDVEKELKELYERIQHFIRKA